MYVLYVKYEYMYTSDHSQILYDLNHCTRDNQKRRTKITNLKSSRDKNNTINNSVYVLHEFVFNSIDTAVLRYSIRNARRNT